MIAFLREWGALVVPLALVLVLLVVFLRAVGKWARNLSAFVGIVEGMQAQLDAILHEQDVQATNLVNESSARGGSDASLDMKTYLLADYLEATRPAG